MEQKDEYWLLKDMGYHEQAEQNQRKRFEISFLEGVPGCGCGCDDNDKNVGDKTQRRRYEFFGTADEAEKSAMSLQARNDAYVRWNFHVEEIKNGK